MKNKALSLVKMMMMMMKLLLAFNDDFDTFIGDEH